MKEESLIYKIYKKSVQTIAGIAVILGLIWIIKWLVVHLLI
jgi:hypothetical protein